MQAFEYTPGNLLEIEKSLSTERLRPYAEKTHWDMRAAVRLYEQNTLLSESLYGMLQGLEVTLRNTMHGRLTSAYGVADWYSVLQLGSGQSDMLRRAKETLTKERKLHDPARIVAELPFGFWTGLIGPGYNSLWRSHLVKIVPRRPVQRTQMQVRLNSIRKLRNRIAHHEPILDRPLQKDANQIIDTIAWMSPVTARWVRSNSSFDERYARYLAMFPARGTKQP